MSEYKKCEVPTCHNDMSGYTYSCGECWGELSERARKLEFLRENRYSKVSTHIPKHDKRHGPFGKCRVHDCESTAHEQTKLCQSHQDASKCCFDDCDNVTYKLYCSACNEKREHALTTWEKAGSPVFSSRNPNSIDFYNQQLKVKAELQKKAVEQSPKIEEKPIPPIKCRCCDKDRVRGMVECAEDHMSPDICCMLGCGKEASNARCKEHQYEYDKSPLDSTTWAKQFESEEDYRKSQEHAKKKDQMAVTFNLNIDQEQLKKLGEKVQAEYEQQVRERMKGLQFDFIAPTDFGPVTIPIRAASEGAAGYIVSLNPDGTMTQTRDEHKHAESCGQLSLQQVQAIIDNQAQEEVDARKEAHAKHKEEQMDASKFAYFTIDNTNTVTVYPNETCMSISCLAGTAALRRNGTRKVLSESDNFVNEGTNEPIKVNVARSGSRMMLTSVLEDGSMRDVVLEYRNKAHECGTFIVSDTIRYVGIGNWMTSIPNWQKHLDEVRENIKNIRASIATKQQEATMSKTNINTVPVIKEDLEATAWRIAGRQFTKLTRDPIVAAIARGLGDDSEAMRAKVAAFLRTELGTAIFQGMLSTGLSFMPQATGDIPQKMARELRVSAMTSAGDQVADLLMEPLRQVVSLYLSNTPQEVPALGQDTTSVKADVVIPVTVEAKR